MDEALLKPGQWPNVAIEAGTDPQEVMHEYGVEPPFKSVFDEDDESEWEPIRVEKTV